MNRILNTIIIIAFAVAILSIVYWLLVTPKRIKLQPELEEISQFNYATSLIVQKDSTLGETLLLRRVRNSDWKSAGPHTDFEVQTRKEPSMSVSSIKADAYLKRSSDDLDKIIIGRYTDRGSGMHGWHVTMIKQGGSAISFDRHQRYYVWIEKEPPKGFDDEGTPISENPKRWFFAGLADIIAKEKYNGYFEPLEGDK